MSEATVQNELGKTLIQQGRLEEAAAAFERAARLDPDSAEAHNNFANTLNDRQRYDEAIAGYKRAIQLNPKYVHAHFNLGNALRGKGEYEKAIASYQKALELNPSLAEAHNGIGNVYVDLDRTDDAIAAFKKVIAMRPNQAMGYNNLATALRKKGQTEEAFQALQKAVALQPNYVVALSNFGIMLGDRGKYEEALNCLKKAVSLNPGYVEGLSSLIRMLRDLGRAHDAIAICKEIIRAIPNYAEAHGELGLLLQETGKIDEALAACQKALALKPNLPEAHNNLGNVLRDQGQLEGAIQSYRRALELKPDMIGIRSNLAFTLQFASGYDNAAILDENRRWGEIFEKPLLAEHRPHGNRRTKDRPLKIGYVSPYFRSHCAASFLMPLLSNHDPGRVQVYCYSGVRQADPITQGFKNLNHAWRDTAGLLDAQLAKQIRDDQIDILVDTVLHMQDARLLTFARKPAPVQVTWLGYPGTTGLSSIDYRLTDPHLDPLGQGDAFYTERLIRLPSTFWCYAPLMETPGVSPLPAKATGRITFGCFNNFHKVTSATLDLWSKVLGAIPDSRLIILSQPGGHRETVRERFERSGIDPGRIEFVARQPLDEYYRGYRQVDLCLDTIPYPGHTTTLDSLWMGVPVITLAGNTTVGRGGVSILTNMNLLNLIAKTAEEYVAIARAIKDDLEALSALRLTLRDRLRGSPLMNAKQFATDLENAYAKMWDAYCQT
jgi:protein O-GlcNAc transferase